MEQSRSDRTWARVMVRLGDTQDLVPGVMAHLREEAIRDLERHGVPREYVRTVDTDFLFVPGTEPTDAIVLEGPVSQTVVELQTRCEDLRRELMETKAQLFNHLSGSRPGVGGLFS